MDQTIPTTVLRAARDSAGLNQAALAGRLGVSGSVLSRLGESRHDGTGDGVALSRGRWHRRKRRYPRVFTLSTRASPNGRPFTTRIARRSGMSNKRYKS